MFYPSPLSPHPHHTTPPFPLFVSPSIPSPCRFYLHPKYANVHVRRAPCTVHRTGGGAAAASSSGGGGSGGGGGGGGAAVAVSDEPDWVLEHAAKCKDAKKNKETEKHKERELKFKRMRDDLTERRAKTAVRVGTTTTTS